MPVIVCIDTGKMLHYAALDRLKGKQVQVLYDLVTVIRECGFDYVTDAWHWEGRIHMRIYQPGNLPVVWYRENGSSVIPRSRVIGRTVICISVSRQVSFAWTLLLRLNSLSGVSIIMHFMQESIFVNL